MNRTLNVILGTAALMLVATGIASAQTGTLQGRQLFLYDGGTGATLNRIGFKTPEKDTLTANYRLVWPNDKGQQGDILSVWYEGADSSKLHFTNGNHLFWRLEGNSLTTPWDGSTGNFVGTSDAEDLVIRAGDANSIQFWNGSSGGSQKMILDYNGHLGLGVNPGGNYMMEINDASSTYSGLAVTSSLVGGVALYSTSSSTGGIGVVVDANDVGLLIGNSITPVNGIEIDATAVGILINHSGSGAPAVGISMDGTAVGLQITNATTSLDVEGDAFINTTGAGNSSIGNISGGTITLQGNGINGLQLLGNATSAGDNAIVIDPGTAGGAGNEYDLVINNIQQLSPVTDLLWITASNEVRRAPFTATANEGLQFESGAFKLGHLTAGTGNQIVSSRFVNIGAAGTLTVTTAGGTDELLVLNNNADVGISTAGAGNTTIGNTTAGGAVQILANNNVTIDVAATTNNLTLNNIDDDNTTVHVLTLTGANSGNVRTHPLSDLVAADQGVQWNETGSDYEVRLGHATAGTGNQIVSSRFVNIGAAGTLTVTTAGGTDQLLVLNNNADVGISTAGAGNTTIGNTTAGGAVQILANNNVTIDVAATTNNLTLNNIDDDNTTVHVLTLTGANSGNVRTQSLSDLVAADQGVQWNETGSDYEVRLGHATAGTGNQIVSSRFVNVGAGGTLTFRDAGTSTEMLVLNNNGNVQVNTSGTGTTTIGNTTNGGAVNVNSNSGITLTTTGAGQDVTLVSTDDVILNPGDQVTINTGAGSDLSITETTITRAGALTISTIGGGATNLSLSSSDDVVVTADNMTVNVTGGNLTLNTAATPDLVLTETLITRAASWTLSATGAGNDITITTADDLFLNPGDQVFVNTGGAADLSLTETTISRAGGLTIQTTGVGNDIELTAGSDIILTAAGGTPTVEVNTAGGANLVFSETTITRAGALSLTTTAGGDMTVNQAGNLILSNIATDNTVTSILGLNGSNQVRQTNLNAVAWLLGGNTLTGTQTIGSNTNHDVGIETNGTTRWTIPAAGGLTQNGTQQVTFNGNVDATSGLDVTGADLTVGGANFSVAPATGNTIIAGTLTANGNTTLGDADADITTIRGAINLNTTNAAGATTNISTSAFNNITNIGSNTAGNTINLDAPVINAANLPAGAATNTLVTTDGTQLFETSVTTMISDVAWLLGGNTLTGTQTIGSNSNHDVALETDGTTRWTIPAAGGLTQNGTQQVTFNGNVDATNGLDVSGADLTVATNASVTGNLTTNGNVTLGDGAGTDVISITSSGGTSDVTITTGRDLILNGIDADATDTRLLTIDASTNVVSYRDVSTIIGASEGVVYNETGTDYEVRLGSLAAGTGNQVTGSRFVNVGAGGTLTFRNAGTSTEMLVLNNNGNVQLNTSGTGTTTIGNTTSGGAVNVNSNSGITLTTTGAGNDVTLVAPDQIILNPSTNVAVNTGIDPDLIITESGISRTLGAINISNTGPHNVSISTGVGGSAVITGNQNVSLTSTSGNTSIVTSVGNTTITTATGNTVLTTSSGNTNITSTAGDVTVTAGDDITITTANNLILNGIAADNTQTTVLTLNGSNQVRRTDVGSVAWLLGGNTLTGTQTIGSNSNHDVGIETNGTTRWTIPAGGGLTQTGNHQVTFTGNVDATNGLDVSGADLTVATNASVTGSLTVNGNVTLGDGTGTDVVNITSRDADVTISALAPGSPANVVLSVPGSTNGSLILNNIDQDNSTTKILTLNGTDEVRWRDAAAFVTNADQGVQNVSGEIRLGAGTDGANPILTARYVTVDNVAGSLVFNNGAGGNSLTVDGLTGNLGVNTAALADWELTVERTDYTGGSPRGAINAIATNSTGSANAPRGIRSTATSNGSFAYGIESRAVFNGTQSGFDVTKAVSGLYASADNGGQDIMAIGTQSFANTANTDGINLGVMGTARNGASNIGVGGAAGASDAEIATLATTIRTSNVSAGVVGYTTLTGAADYGVAAYAPGSSGKALVASANGTGGTAITAVATNAGGGTGVNVDATTVGVNVTNAVTSFQGTGNLTIDGNSTLGNASGDETTINGFTILAPGTAVTGITSAAAPGTSLGPIDATYLTREVATVSTAPDNFVKLPDGTQDGQLLYLVVSNSDLVDDLIIRNEADIFDYTTVGSDSTVLIHAIWHNGLNRWLIVSVTAQP